jgi:hypothetical protein
MSLAWMCECVCACFCFLPAAPVTRDRPTSRSRWQSIKLNSLIKPFVVHSNRDTSQHRAPEREQRAVLERVRVWPRLVSRQTCSH